MATIIRQRRADGIRYKAVIRRKGAPHRARWFRTRAQAERWARKIDASVDDRRAIPSARAESKTVRHLIARYRERVLPEYSGPGKKERERHLTPHLVGQ